MSFRTFIVGLLFVPIGVVLLLTFSVTETYPLAPVVKWLGVALMIGGPLVFWEILPVWTERDDGAHAPGISTKESVDA